MLYASVEDVSMRTVRSFTPDEEVILAALLDDAGALIDACAKDADCEAKRIVSCRMVLRVMGAGDLSGAPIGATQGTMTAGPYSQSWTIGSGSNGELYLSKADKLLLGVGSRIGARSPLEAAP